MITTKDIQNATAKIFSNDSQAKLHREQPQENVEIEVHSPIDSKGRRRQQTRATTTPPRTKPIQTKAETTL